MGSFFSIPSREKRRRSNRLSKPPANNKPASISANSPRQPSNSCSPTAATWQNPWTGVSIPVASPDSEPNTQRSHSSASVSLQSDPSWIATSKTKRSSSSAKESSDVGVYSPTPSLNASGTLSRRASFQPSRQPAFQPTVALGEPRSRWPSPGQPRRSYSVQSPPRRAKNIMNTSSIEEATSSNTHFLVDNQGFSLIRRRSLLTRPGIATRQSTKDAARRCPSPIKQEPASVSTTVHEVSRSSPWPPSRRQDIDTRLPPPLSQLRPPTPNDFEYTHLGALKLGSLRVVNGSTSPCPSERSRRNRPRSRTPEAFPDNSLHVASNPGSVNINHQGIARTDDSPSVSYQGWITRSESISSNPVVLGRPLSHNGRGDELLASPLPHEEPSIYASPAFYQEELEAKIPLSSSDQKILTSRCGKTIDGDPVTASRQSVPHKKIDSGYSSAASDRSQQASRVGSSLDSLAFIQPQTLRYRRFTLGGCTRDATGRDAKETSAPGNYYPALLPPNLRESQMTYRHESGGWSTSMCHESLLKPLNGRLRSLSYAGPGGSTRIESLPRYCTHLRSQESNPSEMTRSLKGQNATSLLGAQCQEPSGGLDTGRERNSSVGPESFNDTIAACGSQPGEIGSIGTGVCRVVSEDRYYSEDRSKQEHPRFYGGASKLLCMESAAEESPATVKLSTSRSFKSEHHFDAPRGRSRCRSVDYQRRRLSKRRKGPSTYHAAASPFSFRG